jgi:GT2 family glycosyltransferase
VQSVLYGNDASDIVRAVAALANSVSHARADSLIASWSLQLGDCSPQPVMDEASQAAIRADVEAAGGSLAYTVFGANLGSAAGHNRLATLSDSDLLLILNPDAQVAPDTISVLTKRVVDRIGIAEARQVPLEHPKEFRKYDGDTSWASTACALTPRAAFDEIGGFDSDTFFLYCDDVDYSWRLRLAGYRVVYEPAAAVFHDKRLTITGDWPASAAEIYYSAEAAILLAYKYSRLDLVRSILARFRKEGTEPLVRAVAEFDTRKSAGRLPTQLDKRHSVAEFVKDNYAVHRF